MKSILRSHNLCVMIQVQIVMNIIFQIDMFDRNNSYRCIQLQINDLFILLREKWTVLMYTFCVVKYNV